MPPLDPQEGAKFKPLSRRPDDNPAARAYHQPMVVGICMPTSATEFDDLPKARKS